MVVGYAKKSGVPMVSTFAGGYARNVGDTVKIHCGTILAMRDGAEVKR
jgi:hypothetical protein